MIVSGRIVGLTFMFVGCSGMEWVEEVCRLVRVKLWWLVVVVV